MGAGVGVSAAITNASASDEPQASTVTTDMATNREMRCDLILLGRTLGHVGHQAVSLEVIRVESDFIGSQ